MSLGFLCPSSKPCASCLFLVKIARGASSLRLCLSMHRMTERYAFDWTKAGFDQPVKLHLLGMLMLLTSGISFIHSVA